MTVTEPTRLHCNLNPETAEVMVARRDNENVSFTEQVRRGISVYHLLDTETKAGATVHLRYPDGTVREVIVL